MDAAKNNNSYKDVGEEQTSERKLQMNRDLWEREHKTASRHGTVDEQREDLMQIRDQQSDDDNHRSAALIENRLN